MRFDVEYAIFHNFLSIFPYKKESARKAYLQKLHQYNSNYDDIHNLMSPSTLDATLNLL